MATNVMLPQWGMNMEDGLLVKWLVQEGDTVEKGQPLVEIETAKINSELEAPESGIVAHIMVDAGTTVDVGTIVLVLGMPGEDVPRPTSTKPEKTARQSSRQSRRSTPKEGNSIKTQVTPIARRLAKQNNINLEKINGTGPKGRITEDDVRKAIEQKGNESDLVVQIVPRARLIARTQGIDISAINGTGPNGRITVADIENIVSENATDHAPTAEISETIPLEGLRKTISNRMTQSVQSMAQVTLTTEADVTELVNFRENLLREWRPHRIRPMDQELILKATASTLKDHPHINATLTKDSLNLMKEINVGVAMAVPDGLLVPVIEKADTKDLLDIAKEIRTMADKARKGKLTINDMLGASFTITSLASYDIDAFTPIIDPPQVAILGVGRIVEKPAVHEGKIAIRSMMFLSITFDHRALDGVPVGEFLRALTAKLENPTWMHTS